MMKSHTHIHHADTTVTLKYRIAIDARFTAMLDWQEMQKHFQEIYQQ
jgi:hypothetical protein